MSTSRPDSSDFRALFLTDTPMMDTRAPLEYKRGAFPETVSLPLMTDAERAKVGTCYKQQGQDKAIELGHQIVAGNIKQQRLEKWLAFAEQNPNGYLYCFRGGLRSQIVQRWLKEAGCDYPRITGGYKAMRRFLIDTLERISAESRFTVLTGHTGCAKTDLLNQLDNSIDLEGLAHHRGSTFGKRAKAQPSQIDFENKLAIALLREEERQHQQNADQPVHMVLEDESMLVGRCAIPPCLRERTQQAELVLVEAELEQRVEHSFNNYILNKLAEWQQQEGDEAGFAAFSADLTKSLHNIRRRLGGVRFQQLNDLLQQALSEHQRGENNLHREWIRPLLEEYYDPMYEYQLSQKQGEIRFRGDAQAVTEFLRSKAN